MENIKTMRFKIDYFDVWFKLRTNDAFINFPGARHINNKQTGKFEFIYESCHFYFLVFFILCSLYIYIYVDV